MSPRELLEVAGLVAFHAPSLLAETSRLNDEAVGAYWLASRCRLDRWGYSLRAYAHASRGPTGDPAVRLAPLAEEIVACEVLTRCVAGICHAHDRLHHRLESAPLGKNILTGHREAIDRLHEVTGTWWSHESTSHHALQSFVERCERWTDLLLGHLHSTCDVSEFAFDPPRMIDFAEDHAEARFRGHELCCGNLLIVSLRAAFGDVGCDSPNGDLHSQIAGAALGCFGPAAFDSFGLLRSTWLDRMQRTTEETDALIAQEIAGPPRGPARRA
jgi:hypothetical protein